MALASSLVVEVGKAERDELGDDNRPGALLATDRVVLMADRQNQVVRSFLDEPSLESSF